MSHASGAGSLDWPVSGSVHPAERQAHRSSVELLRFVCAFGIIWFHMQAPRYPIAYSSLAAFLILAAFLAAGSLKRGGQRRFWANRGLRIALPWLAWSAFYLVVNMVLLRSPLAALSLHDPLSLLIGPSIHLWFLPFILAASVAISLVVPAIRDRGSSVWLTILAIPVGVVSLHLHSFASLPEPLAQWSLAVPSICYGVISACGKRYGLPLAPAGFLVAFAAASLATGGSDGLLQLSIAAAAFEAIWRLDLPARVLREFGRVSFGIYLVHPFFVLVYFKLIGGDGRSIGAVVVVFALSALATAVMARTPGVRRLV